MYNVSVFYNDWIDRFYDIVAWEWMENGVFMMDNTEGDVFSICPNRNLLSIRVAEVDTQETALDVS